MGALSHKGKGILYSKLQKRGRMLRGKRGSLRLEKERERERRIERPLCVCKAGGGVLIFWPCPLAAIVTARELAGEKGRERRCHLPPRPRGHPAKGFCGNEREREREDDSKSVVKRSLLVPSLSFRRNFRLRAESPLSRWSLGAKPA